MERIMAEYQRIYRKKLFQEIEATPEEYLPGLLNIVRSFRQSVTLKPADESFRQGWQEVLNGEFSPLSELWIDVDAE